MFFVDCRSIVSERLFLFCDDFALFGLRRIQFDVALPFLGNIVFVKNCFHGTLWNASFAIDAFLRVDVQHLIAFVETLYGADDNAISVFASRAGLGNYMCHVTRPFSNLF